MIITANGLKNIVVIFSLVSVSVSQRNSSETDSSVPGDYSKTTSSADVSDDSKSMSSVVHSDFARATSSVRSDRFTTQSSAGCVNSTLSSVTSAGCANSTSGSVTSPGCVNSASGGVTSAGCGNSTSGGVTSAHCVNSTSGSVTSPGCVNSASGGVTSAGCGNSTSGGVTSAHCVNSTSGSVTSPGCVNSASGGVTSAGCGNSTSDSVTSPGCVNSTSGSVTSAGYVTSTSGSVTSAGYLSSTSGSIISADYPKIDTVGVLHLIWTSATQAFIQTPGWDKHERFLHKSAYRDIWVDINVPANRWTLMSASVTSPVPCRHNTLDMYVANKSSGNWFSFCNQESPVAALHWANVFTFHMRLDRLLSVIRFQFRFTFFLSSDKPEKLPTGKWNCSVANFADFSLHFHCNLETECAGGEDEKSCPYTGQCRAGQFQVGDRCYTYTRPPRDVSWNEASVDCTRKGGYLASLNTKEEWDGMVKVIQDKQWMDTLYLGLRRSGSSMPSM
ncbi:hypothetical protein BaRGS_00038716 [Batillaria attramentaria]|uniref:C-type lectin domain-containing protein n=1 Tax=Batillaria attramentaria TaxID=370345 RepID=A0ABD0J604_9CAEN